MRRLGLLALLLAVPACGLVLGIKDLVPGEASDGGADENSSPPADAGPRPPADGSATADGDIPDGPITCGDVTANDEHCGRCGHSCLGGKCVGSVCQPTTLATGQGMVAGVAVDATHVYFTSLSNNVVARVPKMGGAVVTLASAPSVALAKHIAVNGTHVDWANADCCSGTVARCPLAGCPNPAAADVVETATEPLGIALDATHVYWADRNGGTVERKPLAGGARELVGVGQGALPMAVAVDDGHAFWIGDFSGEVRRSQKPPDGGSISIGANGQSGRDLALDPTNVYWGVAIDPGEPGRIVRAPRSGAGPAVEVGPANGEPFGVIVDGQLIYWTASRELADGGPGGGVYSCSVNGCGAGATVVAGGQDVPRGIAVDATAIYWGVNQSVMKLAKP